MTTLIRARSLTGYTDLVRELGGDPLQWLALCDIQAAALDDDQAVIPHANAIHLLETTAERLPCGDFGLRLAQRQSIQILGPLALIAQNAGSVAEVISLLDRYMHYYSPAISVAVDAETAPHLRRVTFSINVEGCPKRRQAMELSLALTLSVLRMLVGRDIGVDRVLFRHEAGLPLARYRKWFSCPVLFGQEVNALVMDAALLTKPIEQSSLELRRMAEAYVESIIARRPMDLIGQVRALIERLLTSNQCTLNQVAAHLCLHERTLQRRLLAAGMSFELVLDQVRRQRAGEYLAQQRIPMSQITELLGYAEQSSFNRACKRWFDRTPKRVRDELAASP